MKRFTNKMLGVIPQDLGVENNPLGEIRLANEARFTAIHFSEPLTTYAIGWQDPENIRETLDALFPPVEVARRFEYKAGTDSEAFLSETDDIRAIGSAFKRVAYKGTSVNEKTHNKGLTIRLDRDEMTEGSEERAVSRLLARLDRNDLRRGIALIIAAASNSDKTWDTTAKKDPDYDVLADLETGGDARGINTNIVVYGASAWTKRLLSLRAQNLAGQANSSTLTPAQVADFLAVDKVMLSKERYQSSASAKSKILGSYVLMYYAQQNLGKDDPSNVKQFWTPTSSGRSRVYRQEYAKFVEVTVEHYSNLAVTSTLGVRMFTVS